MVGMLLNFNQFFFLNIAKFSFAKKYISCSSKHWTRKKFDFLKVRHNEIFLLKTFQTFKHLQYFFFQSKSDKVWFFKSLFFLLEPQNFQYPEKQTEIAQYNLNKIISELSFPIHNSMSIYHLFLSISRLSKVVEIISQTTHEIVSQISRG